MQGEIKVRVQTVKRRTNDNKLFNRRGKVKKGKKANNSSVLKQREGM